MKVVVLGNTGMLGHMVEEILTTERGFEVRGFGRETFDLKPRSLNYIGTKLSQYVGFDTDWIINCIGATKPFFTSAADLSVPLYVNAVFPHQLATWAQLLRKPVKVLHVTTDCVFDGLDGPYDEDSPHTAQDLYGKSKSLGEPANCMVLRTSIIGPEKNNSRHLLSWIKGQDGKECLGFTNHYWNGVTTLELAHLIGDLIHSDIYELGCHHVFSSDVTKYGMVKEIARTYGFDIKLRPHETSTQVDRRLRTTKDLNQFLCPGTFSNMIKEMREYEARKVGKF